MAPPYVADEWNKNAQRTISNVKKRLVKLDREFDVAAASSNAVNITIEERKTLFSNTGLEQKLKTISENLLNSGIWLTCDNRILAKAHQRLVKELPPSNKGQFTDCIIYEHSLELFTLLRGHSFSKKCLFMTSNANDYFQKNTSKPKESIGEELESVSVSLVKDWNWAFNELLKS